MLTAELGSRLRRTQGFSLGLFYLSVFIFLILNRTKCSNTEKLLLKHAVIKMTFIKVESEDVKIEEHEDTETQTGQFSFSKCFFCYSVS